jgi:hypothetical protein
VYLRISSSDFGQQMPLSGALSAEAINTIKTWIDEGAVWPDALARGGGAPPSTRAQPRSPAPSEPTISGPLLRTREHPGAVNRLASAAPRL